MKKTFSMAATAASVLALGATLAQADQQILDDLIVDGSACIGLDCVNGESFGFDTLRLKENNLRIKAQDTSTSASFPTNDWQITFNESSNGGANKFSVDDIDAGRTPFTIEAGSPANGIYLDSSGNVGFSTNTPVANLHVRDGNTPTLRLEQDGSQGFTAQTWDLAGNEANFFLRDATNGSTLPFRVFPSAPSNALTVGASGNVGIGIQTPADKLHLRTTANETMKIVMESANAAIAAEWELAVRSADGQLAINDDTAPGAEFIFNGASATTPGLAVTGDVTASNQLVCNGTAGACVLQTSDIRMKPDARTLTDGAEIVRALRPIVWGETDGTASTGFGAQEVAEAMQLAGLDNWTGHRYDAESDLHMISYDSLISVLVSAHHEKDARIEALESALGGIQQQLDAQ